MSLFFIILFFTISQFSFAQLQITEVMYNPEGSDDDLEWFEVFNNYDYSIEIKGNKSGWIINDGKNHRFKENLLVNPKEIFIIVQNKEKFLKTYSDYRGKLIEANFYLKNKNGKIQLLDEKKNLIAEIFYDSSCGGNGNGYSIVFEYQRCFEGKTKNGSPGWLEEKTDLNSYVENKNQNTKTDNYNILEKILDQNRQENNLLKNNQLNISTSENYKITESLEKEVIPQLIITEFLPNPEGSDTNKEFIEIFNPSDEIADLDQISIKIGNKKIKLSGHLDPRKYLVIYNDQNNFSIRNKGEVISVYFKDSEIFSISYQGKSPIGKSLSRFGSNYWQFSQPTPGSDNIFPEEIEEKNSFLENNPPANSLFENENKNSSSSLLIANVSSFFNSYILLGIIISILSLIITLIIKIYFKV